jgi:ribonuclease P protein component
MDRILRRRDFLAAAKSRSAPVSGVLMQMLDRADDKPARVGFTCTKKLGNAVVRNRVRRRLKEAARLVLPKIARIGHDYVIIGRASSMNRPFEDLKKDIISAVSKLHAEPFRGNSTPKSLPLKDLP